MYKLKIQGLNSFVAKQTELITNLANKECQALANEAKFQITQNLNDSRERSLDPQGSDIIKNVEVEKIEEGYGVGNIQKLDTTAPYWYWINFGIARSGRRIPPGTNDNPRIKGHFEPTTNGRFVKNSPRLPLYPKKPITAHNYIERTWSYILSNVKQIISGVR